MGPQQAQATKKPPVNRRIVLKKQKDHPARQSLNAVHYLDSAGNLIRTQATGAGVNVARRTVDNRLNSLNVWFPGSVGTPVRMRNLNTESDTLSADVAFSHVSAPPLTGYKVNVYILADSRDKSKGFCAKNFKRVHFPEKFPAIPIRYLYFQGIPFIILASLSAVFC